MVSKTIDACPFCHATPSVVGRWRFQVSCDCGVCGPKVGTHREAIHRWSSVVRYIGKWRHEFFDTSQISGAIGSPS